MSGRRFQRGGPGGLGLLLLAYEVMNIGVENIPIVTLVLTAGQSVLHLGLINHPLLNQGSDQVCISASTICYDKQWSRLILSAFFHADDFHLYFNMASFIWKGKALEPMFGKWYFAYLIAVFTICCSWTYVGLSFLLAHVLHSDTYLYTCAVGFSGVIFALKVLCMHYSPPGNVQLIMGLSVPSKYAVWAELALIQVMSPNASFVGHLAGILVGLLYVHGPLSIIMDTLYHFVFSLPTVLEQNRPRTYGQRPSYTYQAGRSGNRQEQDTRYGGQPLFPTAPPPDYNNQPRNDRGDMPRHRYDLRSTFR